MGWKHRFSTNTSIVVGCQMLKVDDQGVASCDGILEASTLDSLKRHPNWSYLKEALVEQPLSGDGADLDLPSPDEIFASREAGETYKDVSATIADLTGGLDHPRGWDAMIEAYTEWYNAR